MTRAEILEKYADERTRCERYTRVTGYHRPIECFNIGKQQEHKDRLYFKEAQNEG